MKKEIDWGTWLSMGAVVIVCLVIAVKLMPGPGKADAPTAEASTAEQATGEAPSSEDGDPQAAGSKKKSKDQEEKKDEKKEEKKAEPAPGSDGLPPAASAKPAGYRVNTPDATFELPRTLDEISGLSASAKADSLWAVHDERPILFRISVKDGSVLQEIALGKRGDYEGVEEAEGKVYVARSDGVLYVVDPAGGEPTRLNFQREVGLACDLEGLGYEIKKKRLLLTCKNEGSKTRKSNKAFEVYAMDLQSKAVLDEPAFVLTEKAIDDYIASHPEQEDLKNTKGKSFAPSGISVHPQTGEIYIISTRGKMMVILSAKGDLLRVDALDPTVHPQPEGVTFTADGTLFIANEAHGKRALLQVFKFKTAKD